MTTLPASGYLSNAARTIAEMKQAFEDLRDLLAETIGTGGAAEQALVIAGGNITPAVRASRVFNVDTEAAAATDDLDHILQTNVSDGGLVLMRSNNAGRTVVVRHAQGGAGQILLADGANFSLVSTKMWLLLQRRGTDWNEVLRWYGDQKTAYLTFLGAAALGAGNTLTPTQQVKSTQNDALENIAVDLYRSRANGVNADLLESMIWSANSTTGVKRTLVRALAKMLVATNGAEDGELRLSTIRAGVLTEMLVLGKAGVYTPNATGSDKGADSINASALYDDGVPVTPANTVVVAGTTHSPAAADNGTQFIYTNAGGCTVTLPAASGLPVGYSIGGLNASGGTVTYNRSASDTVWSKNTSLTSLKLPIAGDGGWLHLDQANAKYYWRGKRSSTPADFASTASTDTAVAHNLGVAPDNVRAQLVCTTNNLNYTAGEIVELGNPQINAGGGFVMQPDGTNINFKTANLGIGIPNKTTFTVTNITTANWNYRLTATVWN